MKIVAIVEAHPQFIKCAAVSREVRGVASEVLVHTGQHYDGNMSDLLFLGREIPKPDYNLEVGSCLLFCPTNTAVNNLAQEGITDGVELVDDVMYEALLHNLQIAESRLTILTRLNLQSKGYFLVTVRRVENTDDGTRLQSILVELQKLSAIHPVIWPVHPSTRQAIENHHPSLQINQTLHLSIPFHISTCWY